MDDFALAQALVVVDAVSPHLTADWCESLQTHIDCGEAFLAGCDSIAAANFVGASMPPHLLQAANDMCSDATTYEPLILRFRDALREAGGLKAKKRVWIG